jgi:hypothetical protein
MDFLSSLFNLLTITCPFHPNLYLRILLLLVHPDLKLRLLVLNHRNSDLKLRQHDLLLRHHHHFDMKRGNFEPDPEIRLPLE